MAERSKTRKCPACARLFIKGRKAIVSSKLRLVCLSCAAGATRIVTSIATVKCASRRCNGTAAMCVSCHSDEVREALAQAYARPRAAIEAMIRGLVHVAPIGGDAARDHVQGKIEGLESALAMLLSGRA